MKVGHNCLYQNVLLEFYNGLYRPMPYELLPFVGEKKYNFYDVIDL